MIKYPAFAIISRLLAFRVIQLHEDICKINLLLFSKHIYRLGLDVPNTDRHALNKKEP